MDKNEESKEEKKIEDAPKKNLKFLWVGLAVLVLIGIGFYLRKTKTNPNQPNAGKQSTAEQQSNATKSTTDAYTVSQGELVFFWGQGCPHCENVEKFLQGNQGLEEKLKLKKIEVFGDQKGQALFLEKAKECKLATPGVPVLYKDGQCTQGDTPIINELKKSL